ncbi:MAG: NAD-dependent epimerase/dehydratase family protein [Miltoncostaeaceae bacterium]
MSPDTLTDTQGRPILRALVTGAAGFIGSHLTEALLDLGVEVTGLDCFTRYYDEERKRANLMAARDHRRFTLVEEDLGLTDLDALLDGADAVFHLAAQPGVRASWGEGFQDYVTNNIVATQRLLEAMSGTGVPLVYSSSSSVYGDAPVMPTPEGAATGPVSPYGATKLTGENLCRMYSRDGRVHTVSLRYFTVYGPRQRPDMAFTRFIEAAGQGRPITLYGDGEQSRDFTFVSDAVDANLRALRHGGSGAVYNIGGGEHASVNGILAILGDLLGGHIAVDRHPTAAGDARHTSADVSLARREIGFDPTVGLREGLARQVASALGRVPAANPQPLGD